MNKRHGVFAVVILAVALAGSAPVLAAPKKAAAEVANLTHLHDFDFLMGDWSAHHRRLKARLVGSTDWIEFDGTLKTRALMAGWGNSGDNLFDMPGGVVRGVSLRAYDPKTGQWLVWWVDARDPLGDIGPPIRGDFKNGVGHFYSETTQDGKPVRVRVTWTRPGPDRARWEQALSADGGKTWEINWITDFTRAAQP